MEKKYPNRTKSQARPTNQQVNQIQRKSNFDNIFDDFGFGSRINEIEKRFFNNDHHEDMFSFGFGNSLGNIFSEMQSYGGGNAPGTFISKSYVSTTKVDKDGRPQKEVYQSQSISQTDEKGKRLTEHQKAYNNSLSGLQKASHERKIDDRGHKIVKARNKLTGDQYEHNHYKGMEEDHLNNFNNEYSDFKKKLGDFTYPKKNYLQGGNSSNYQKDKYELPDYGYNKNIEDKYSNLRKKY